MTDRPILFSGPMVRAILQGRKHQTRRLTGLKQFNSCPDRWRREGEHFAFDGGFEYAPVPRCPYGQPGDRLWVRESAKLNSVCRDQWVSVHYLADDELIEYPYRDPKPFNFLKPTNSLFMPRWASRITLEVTNIRVERVQQISEEDAEAEGFPIHVVERTFLKCYPEPNERARKRIEAFARYFDLLNPGTWDLNPYVWVLEFKEVTS